MDMDRYLPLRIALGDSPFMYGAVETLDGLSKAVEIIIEIFRPCVEEGRPALALGAFVRRPAPYFLEMPDWLKDRIAAPEG